tara:strand:- start:61 stop:753 length:693 start_codon:yes stop_codon:yes gene_type:complete
MENEKNEVTYGVLNWGPCVMQLKISDSFKDKLLKGAEDARSKNLGYQDKLAGIIKEEYMYERIQDFLPEISQVLGVYDQAFQKFKNEKYKQKPEYLLTTLWVNYMKRHEFNPPHDHSDQLSFVIFLKVPEEIKEEQRKYVGKSGGPGSLSFVYGEGSRQAITYQSVIPNENDMFVFPAWLKHYVSPFYSDVTRISVSGNIADAIPLNQIKRHAEQLTVNAEKVEAQNNDK